MMKPLNHAGALILLVDSRCHLTSLKSSHTMWAKTWELNNMSWWWISTKWYLTTLLKTKWHIIYHIRFNGNSNIRCGCVACLTFSNVVMKLTQSRQHNGEGKRVQPCEQRIKRKHTGGLVSSQLDSSRGKSRNVRMVSPFTNSRSSGVMPYSSSSSSEGMRGAALGMTPRATIPGDSSFASVLIWSAFLEASTTKSWDNSRDLLAVSCARSCDNLAASMAISCDFLAVSCANSFAFWINISIATSSPRATTLLLALLLHRFQFESLLSWSHAPLVNAATLAIDLARNKAEHRLPLMSKTLLILSFGFYLYKSTLSNLSNCLHHVRSNLKKLTLSLLILNLQELTILYTTWLLLLQDSSYSTIIVMYSNLKIVKNKKKTCWSNLRAKEQEPGPERHQVGGFALPTKVGVENCVRW